MKEDREAVDEGEDREPERAPVREVWLERVVVEQLRPVDALRLESSICVQACGIVNAHRPNTERKQPQIQKHVRKKMYVTFIAHQLMNPPTADRLTNQLNTVAPPALAFMNASSPNALEASTAAIGRPPFVQCAKTFGAWPRRASP